jgi:hypothetical protein
MSFDARAFDGRGWSLRSSGWRRFSQHHRLRVDRIG